VHNSLTISIKQDEVMHPMAMKTKPFLVLLQRIFGPITKQYEHQFLIGNKGL